MGQAGSSLEVDPTLTTRVVKDKGWLDLIVNQDYGEEGKNNAELWLSEDVFVIDEEFFTILSTLKFSTISLSAVGICLNILLFIVLLTDADTKKWHVFPILLQIACDIIGPGFANIVYELIFSLTKSSLIENEIEELVYGLGLIKSIHSTRIGFFLAIESKLACTLTYLRDFFVSFPLYLLWYISAVYI